MLHSAKGGNATAVTESRSPVASPCRCHSMLISTIRGTPGTAIVHTAGRETAACGLRPRRHRNSSRVPARPPPRTQRSSSSPDSGLSRAKRSSRASSHRAETVPGSPFSALLSASESAWCRPRSAAPTRRRRAVRHWRANGYSSRATSHSEQGRYASAGHEVSLICAEGTPNSHKPKVHARAEPASSASSKSATGTLALETPESEKPYGTTSLPACTIAPHV